MDNDTFSNLVQMQVGRIESVLIQKGKEYADKAPDRLVAFKKGAALLGDTTEHYCASLMTKHIVSSIEMATSDQSYPDAVWDEKITDAMNYYVLLLALVEERKGTQTLKAASNS